MAVGLGIVHAYFLWDGDILMRYGIAGLFLFPFRKLSGRAWSSRAWSCSALRVPTAMTKSAAGAFARGGAAAEARKATGAQVDPQATRRLERSWQDELDDAHPDADTIQESLDAHHGGYWKLFLRRTELIDDFTAEDFFDTVGMMLVGMGLVKLGIITGGRSTRFYATLCLAGLAIRTAAARLRRMVGLSPRIRSDRRRLGDGHLRSGPTGNRSGLHRPGDARRALGDRQTAGRQPGGRGSHGARRIIWPPR